MILFIPNIPADIKNDELRDFVNHALQAGFFFHRQLGIITKLEELAIRDKTTDTVEYHGLIHVDNRQAGLRAIKKLNGKPFGNNTVEVREYATRMQENDRRLAFGPAPLDISDIVDRRIGDRRRKGDQKEVFKRNFQ